MGNCSGSLFTYHPYLTIPAPVYQNQEGFETRNTGIYFGPTAKKKTAA
jgi:hypothetical protein